MKRVARCWRPSSPLAGCRLRRGGAEPGVPKGATLVLDFQPNAVHTGIYAAAGSEGSTATPASTSTVQEPSANRPTRRSCSPPARHSSRSSTSTTSGSPARGARPGRRDADRAAAAGRGDRRRPQRRPRPRDLEGRTVGVTGLPSDDAVLDSEVGRRRRSRSGPPGDDRLQRRLRRSPPARSTRRPASGTPRRWRCAPGGADPVFRVDDYGAPRYPELVLCTTSKTLKPGRPGLVHEVVDGDGARVSPSLAVSEAEQKAL
jgi:putative hydroxymethylpyrimidine transport system substrate-binding protein